MSLKRCYTVLLLGLLAFVLSGCIFSSEAQQARDTTEKFWKAVLQEDMETAKQLATWESAQYLQFLSSKSVAAQRFETGEVRVEGATAEVATLLYSGQKADMQIPLRTVLVRHQDNYWQVDIQKTLGSLVSGAMGAVADQVNQFMNQGLQELDKALADSVQKLNQNLQQGIDELKKELTEPLTPLPQTPPPAPAAPKQAI